METVLIVGGGINGLSAAHELQKWKNANNRDIRIILTEAQNHLGGKIKTVEAGGFMMETGADSIVSRKVMGREIFSELNLSDEVVYNGTGRSYLFTDGEIKPIPVDAVFGIPTSIESLAKSTLVSAEGKVRALKDVYHHENPFTVEDSIGDFLTYYFGEELVEKQIAPVLSGVYSGKLQDLTISSTLPAVFEYKEKYGSIIMGFNAHKEKYQSSGERKFLSFKNGLSTIIDAYEKSLGAVEIKKGYEAQSIQKEKQDYKVSFSNGEVMKADHIVLSTPHQVAQQLLDDAALNQYFSNMKNSSLISVYIGFDVPDAVLPEDGTGFITSNNNELHCNACTWTSRKWKHTSKSGNLLVRLFYKSSHPSFGRVKDMEDIGLLDLAREDLQTSLKLAAEPIVWDITKWNELMPTYTLDHPQLIKGIEQTLIEKYPGVYIAGSSYYGSGIPDCMENGIEVARRITATL